MTLFKVVATTVFLAWYAGVVAAAVMAIGDSKWQYSLRSLLVALTAFAFVLGLFATLCG
jgi:hypothetical protein